MPRESKDKPLFGDAHGGDDFSAVGPNSNDSYPTEETTLDRLLRQFKSGLFGVLYISALRVTFHAAVTLSRAALMVLHG